MHKTEFNALMASDRIASRMGVNLPRVSDRFSRELSHVRSSQAVFVTDDKQAPFKTHELVLFVVGVVALIVVGVMA